MADLISRATAIEYLMTNMGWHDDDGYEVEDADEKRKVITDLVNGIPAVDAAPVVRCADCKHCFDMGSDPMEPYDGESEWYCERFDRDTSAYEIDPYRFYCADGERRDDDAVD